MIEFTDSVRVVLLSFLLKSHRCIYIYIHTHQPPLNFYLLIAAAVSSSSPINSSLISYLRSEYACTLLSSICNR